MGESINEVIKENLNECTGIADEVSLSVHYQLVLACAWLNLKVTCHCGGKLDRQLIDLENWFVPGKCLSGRGDSCLLDEKYRPVGGRTRLSNRTMCQYCRARVAVLSPQRSYWSSWRCHEFTVSQIDFSSGGSVSKHPGQNIMFVLNKIRTAICGIINNQEVGRNRAIRWQDSQ